MRTLATIARMLAAAVSVGAVGACLSVPAGVQSDCSSDNDCDRSLGEVCSEGVCWGGPPAGAFAATLGAPSTRSDLVPVEIPLLSLPDDGYLGDLALGAPVTLTGRVEMPDRSSVDATITISRPSLFTGGPGFRTVVTSAPNVTGVSFSAQVPRTQPTDPPYTITVVPNGRGDTPADASNDAQTAPPLYTTLAITDNTNAMTMSLGDPSLSTLTGLIVDANSVPLAHYRVVAIGRWDANATPTEVSTVAYTGSDGTYKLVLAANVLSGVKIVAKPYDTVAPTLQFGGFPIGGTQTRTLIQPAGLGAPIQVIVPVEGIDGSGLVSPVSGAHVTLTGTTTVNPQPGASTTATLIADDITDSAGNAHITLLPGGSLGANYTLRIVPPASSNLGVVFDEPVTIDAHTTMLDTHRLDSRIAIRGSIVDTGGNPVGNVAVTVQPSLKFLWSLADSPQAFVSSIPPPTTITPSTGDFVLWVDPIVANVWGYYDLVFEPAVGTDTPDWTVGGIQVPRQSGQADLALGNVTIPDPSFIHGRITDSVGNVVPGGQLRIFELQSDTDLCSTSLNAPMTDCAIPAIVRGSGTADGDGKTRLTLPRSP